jgi:hypothetical protein
MNHDPLLLLITRVMRCGKFGLLLYFFASAQAGTDTLAYDDQALTLDGVSRTVRVPKGYRLEWLSSMDAPRMLTFAANGDLYADSKSGVVSPRAARRRSSR